MPRSYKASREILYKPHKSWITNSPSFSNFFYCTNLPVCSCPTLLCAGAELQQSSWTGTHPLACSFTATSAGFMHYFVPSSAGSSCASWCWRNWKNSRVSLVAAATQGTEQKLGCGGPCLDNRDVYPHHNFIIFCIIWVLFLPRSMGSSAHTSPARILCLRTGQQEFPLAQNHKSAAGQSCMKQTSRLILSHIFGFLCS